MQNIRKTDPIMSDLFLSIQKENAEVQIPCEDDPKDIRNKKKSCASVDSVEEDRVYDHERKKREKPYKREEIRFKIEEYDRPHEVEEELNAVDCERGL